MRVAIYDQNADYSKKLMNYLNGKHGKKIDAVAFTSKEVMEEEISGQKFDCVVCEDTLGFGTIPVIPIIDERNGEGYYRYGSARELAERIYHIDKQEQDIFTGDEKIFAVYSPSNGRIRTDYAWQKARDTGGVYVGMEEYLSMDAEGYWMEEILFFIKERDEGIVDKVKEHIVLRDGVACLPSARSYLDYRYLNYEDYRWFLSKIREESEARFVFDIGIGNLSDFKIFGLFDRIYLLTEDNEKEKNQMYLKLMEQELSSIREKLVFVRGMDA
ncbi:MAG: hypothetical protein MJ087_00290 [Lachnospiraceae bacterium]|nr:hypothetical protein [Lachnospiraceae bacterium]